MKTICAIAFSGFILTGVLQAEEELPEAPRAVLDSIISNCRDYAIEDEVAAEQLNEYLLTCVNQELSDLEYRQLAKL
jgi:hypothetical protein